MHIILLGAPGSGKGTQAQFIMEKYGIPHISTGDMLRSVINNNSDLLKQSSYLMNVGKLVNDDIVIKMVKNRIKQYDCRKGFLLDGFPRTIFQAQSIKADNITIDYVLEFIVPDNIVIDRITGRRIHAISGKIYHTKFNTINQEKQGDLIKEHLITRNDDKKNIVSKRLFEYRQQTAPLIDYYKKEAKVGNTNYFTIDGTQDISKVSAEIAAIIS